MKKIIKKKRKWFEYLNPVFIMGCILATILVLILIIIKIIIFPFKHAKGLVDDLEIGK